MQRPADGLERGLGDVVGVAARRLDVDRQARAAWARLPKQVRRHARVELERQLGVRPAAEIDRRAGERVVHRHGRVAVAGDAAPVAERRVERLAERERRVLDRVVVAGLEVARALERRGRGRRGRRAARGSGRRARRRCVTWTRQAPSRREADGDAGSRRSRAGARAPAAAGARPATAGRAARASASTSRSSSAWSRTVMRIAVGVGAHDEPCRSSRSRARGRRRPGRRGSWCATRAAARPSARSAAASRSRSSITGAGVGRRGERGDGERGRRASRRARAPGGRSAPRRRLARGERVADPRAGEAEEPWRTCAARSTPSSSSGERGLAAVLEVRLVDDERPGVGQRPSSPVGLFGRHAKVSTGSDVADLGAGELRGDPVERVRRRLRDRDRVARPGEGARAEQDQVVGARAEHDVVRRDAVVVGDRRAQRAVAAGG